MKKYLLSALLLVFLSSHVFPQGYKYSASFGMGVTQSYADVTNNINLQPAVHANLDYNVNRFLSTGIEIQYGKIVNGVESLKYNVNYRNFSGYFENNFSGINLNAKINISRMIKSTANPASIFHGLYVGAGVGVVNNNIKTIRLNEYLFGGDPTQYYLEGDTQVTNYSIPVLAGIVVPINKIKHPSLFIGLNSQMNIIPTDKLDGYKENFNKRADYYALTTVVLTYHFRYSSFLNRNIYPH